MNALVGGQVDYMCDQIVNAVPQINGGTIKAYAIATAERSSLEDNPKQALASAELAMKGIPQGSPDWLRAQDIAMVMKTELKKK